MRELSQDDPNRMSEGELVDAYREALAEQTEYLRKIIEQRTGVKTT